MFGFHALPLELRRGDNCWLFLPFVDRNCERNSSETLLEKNERQTAAVA
jgi:hypothetical protein